MSLLTPERVEVLNSSLKPKSVEITRQGILSELEARLRQGFTTTSAGGFFLLPYLMEMEAGSLCQLLCPSKKEGIPPESLALQMVFESIFGYQKGIRSVDPVSQNDFAILSGLPFICSTTTEYRFLTGVSIEQSDSFQIAMGKQLVKTGRISPCGIVNLDATGIRLYSRKDMKSTFLSQDKTYGKAIRAFYTQDQESKKPLFVRAFYSGTTASQATGPVVEGTREVLGDSFLCVMDKEWYVGKLLEEMDKIYGLEVLLPVKRAKRRMKEMMSIPYRKFRKENGVKLATVFIELGGFTGALKLMVKQNQDGSYFGLITNKKYLRPKKGMKIYSDRWRIENWFNENSFLGLNCLPSLELNAIQAMLSMRVLAYTVRLSSVCLQTWNRSL